MIYDGRLTVREALDKYFILSGFGKANYDEKWVKVKLGPIPFVFPNTNARRRAVRFHDIHHVLTEYPTSLQGESLIGAWELASGCGPHIPAWVLNSLAFFIGCFLNPLQVLRAFQKGRHENNLFRKNYDEVLLSRTVGSLRDELKITAISKGS